MQTAKEIRAAPLEELIEIMNYSFSDKFDALLITAEVEYAFECIDAANRHYVPYTGASTAAIPRKKADYFYKNAGMALTSIWAKRNIGKFRSEEEKACVIGITPEALESRIESFSEKFKPLFDLIWSTILLRTEGIGDMRAYHEQSARKQYKKHYNQLPEYQRQLVDHYIGDIVKEFKLSQ